MRRRGAGDRGGPWFQAVDEPPGTTSYLALMSAMLESGDPMRVRPSAGAGCALTRGTVMEIVVPAGTELVRKGEEIGTFFVIRSGGATLSRAGHSIGTLGPGSCFGETEPAPSAARGTAGALTESGGIEHRDGAVAGRDPAEVAHQAQRAGDRLAGRASPPGQLVLG